jgi:hypothetical protein
MGFILTLFIVLAISFSVLFITSLLINDSLITLLGREALESIDEISRDFINQISKIQIQKENKNDTHR